jgi:hypothetical protein
LELERILERKVRNLCTLQISKYRIIGRGFLEEVGICSFFGKISKLTQVVMHHYLK